MKGVSIRVLRHAYLLSLALPLFLNTKSWAQTPTTPIVAQGASLEKVWTGGTHSEGVASAPDGTIYFCDVTPTDMSGPLAAGHIYRFDPRTGKATIFRSPANQANGMKFDAQGRMIVAESADNGGRRVTRTDMVTGKSEIVAARFQNQQLNSPNDVVLDWQGRIYFTDPRYDGLEPVNQPVQGVYRIDLDNSVHLLIADSVPNGVAVSPDNRRLYVAVLNLGATDTRNLPPDAVRPRDSRIMVYPLKPDGTVGQGRVFVSYTPDVGADGILVDAQGNLYAAVGAAGREGIYIYSPTGHLLRTISTPEVPTNMSFGRGIDIHTLYITAGGSLYRIQTNASGFQLPTQPQSANQ